jgi:hypothetical protein
MRHGCQSSSPELASVRTGARQPRVSSSKWSGGQGDPYPRVLDAGLGSLMARGGGDSSMLLQLDVGSFQGISGAQTRRRVAVAPLEVCGDLQLWRVTTEIDAR